MAPRDDIILWLDLETSGSELETSVILEVGICITDQTPQLNELATFTTIIQHPHGSDEAATNEDVLNAFPYPMNMDKVVLDMHTKNGLLKDIEFDKVAPDIREAEKMIVRFLRDNGWSNGNHIPLAGSGVSHFDRQFIRRDWPMFNRMLSYWAYDVGSVRRSLRLAGIELPSGDQSTKSHRALDDARQHADEMRDYIALWRAQAREFRDERHAEGSLEVPR